MKKEDLQNMLKFINRNGSIMRIIDIDGDQLFPMIDSFIVQAVAGQAITVQWREVGYDFGPQYIHTVDFVKFEIDDFTEDKYDGKQIFIFDAVDDIGRAYHCEMIAKEVEPGPYASWKQWNKYKTDNKELFDYLERAF